MDEFQVIFSSPAATEMFFAISAIGLVAMASIAFGTWLKGQRGTRVTATTRRESHSAAWRTAGL